MNPEKPIRIDLFDVWNEFTRDVATCIDIYIELKTCCHVESFVKYHRMDREFSVYVYCPEDKRKEIMSLIQLQMNDNLIKEIKEPITYGKIGHPIKPKHSKKTTMSMRYYDKMKEWFTIEMKKYETSTEYTCRTYRREEHELRKILERMNISDVKKVI